MKKTLKILLALTMLLGMTTALALAHDTTVTLTEENGSGQNGTAVLTDMEDGTTKVSIDLSGGSAVPQPAHIHAGQCGPTLDPRPAYPLTSLVNGKSETIVPVDVHDLTGGTFAINVHKSAAEASVYVACGNIIAATHTEETGMPRAGVGGLLPIAGFMVVGSLLLASLGLVVHRRAAS